MPKGGYGQMGMTLIDMNELFGLRPNGSAGLSPDRFLYPDDVLSDSEDDLGLDVDNKGHLILVGGRDLD